MIRCGVSPAFVFSRHGTAFTPDNYCASLPVISELGFHSYQPEIYQVDALPAWRTGGAVAINTAAHQSGLQASQFVAHFLMEGFASAPRLAISSADVERFKQAVAITREFSGCEVITLPLGPFQTATDPTADAAWYRDQQQRLAEKIAACLAVATAAGLRLALEILPFSLLGNADGFLRLAATLGAPANLGVNLDTGHAWACREIMELLPWKLQDRVFGTHLKDHDGIQNRPLAPGQGTIPWAPFLRALRASGYTGTLDLEIGCPADRVAADYTAGLNHLQSLNLD